LNVDVVSFRAREEQALENLQEALELYFEDAPDDALARSTRLRFAG
jgi:predicted RNase H-like HicB family nuclease